MKNLIRILIVSALLFFSHGQVHSAYKSEGIIGIGVTIEKLADGLVHIVGLIPNSPAEQAGLAVGDLIIEVKTLPNSPFLNVRSLSLEEVVALIRGPEGVPVEILFLRENSEPVILSIIRAVIEIDEIE